MTRITLVVHYEGNVYTFPNKYVINYRLLQFVNDVTNRHSGMSMQFDDLYMLQFELPSTGEKSNCYNDADLSHIFSHYSEMGCKELIFYLKLYTLDTITPTSEQPDSKVKDKGKGVATDVIDVDISEPQLMSHGNNTVVLSPTELCDVDCANICGDLSHHVVLESDCEGETYVEPNFNPCHVFAFDGFLEGYYSDDNRYFHDYISTSSDSDDEPQLDRVANYMCGSVFMSPCGDDLIYLQVGQVFDTVKNFRDALYDFAIQEGFRLKKIKNEKSRVTAFCANATCPWRIHASPIQGGLTYQIKSFYSTHTCVLDISMIQVTANWIARKFLHMILENPKVDVAVLGKAVKAKTGKDCNINILYRAKRAALSLLGEDHDVSYGKLYKYVHVLQLNNPSACVKIQSVSNHFHRLFISFFAQRNGFLNGCRPFFGLDGAHLKGPYGGCILSAVTIDADNGLFPIAICICEGENGESWSWFLALLYDYIGSADNRKLTIMTDRQKGVIQALETHFPHANIRYCARHIFANFRSRFPDLKFRNIFWATVRATNEYDYKAVMDCIKETQEGAYSYLHNIPAKHWSRHAFDQECKTDHVTNNMSESWNGLLNKVRDFPVVKLLEFIRLELMNRLYLRLEKAAKWTGKLTPTAECKLAKASRQSSKLQVYISGNQEFEVHDITRIHLVYLKNPGKCTCGKWQVRGIPCVHVLAAINKARLNPIDFVDKYYTKDYYIKTYFDMIHPIPDEIMWPDMGFPKLLPPTLRRKAGRPKKARRREEHEGPSRRRLGTVKCSLCKSLGHNKRSCPQRYGSRNANISSQSDIRRWEHNIGEISSIRQPSSRPIQAEVSATISSQYGRSSDFFIMQRTPSFAADLKQSRKRLSQCSQGSNNGDTNTRDGKRSCYQRNVHGNGVVTNKEHRADNV